MQPHLTAQCLHVKDHPACHGFVLRCLRQVEVGVHIMVSLAKAIVLLDSFVFSCLTPTIAKYLLLQSA